MTGTYPITALMIVILAATGRPDSGHMVIKGTAIVITTSKDCPLIALDDGRFYTLQGGLKPKVLAAKSRIRIEAVPAKTPVCTQADPIDIKSISILPTSEFD